MCLLVTLTYALKGMCFCPYCLLTERTHEDHADCLIDILQKYA